MQINKLSDYTNITPAGLDNWADFNKTFLCEKPTPENALYQGNKWFVSFRKGLFACQVEKFMQEVTSFFGGYSPEIEMALDIDPNTHNYREFYTASRAIKGFTVGKPVGINAKEYIGLGKLLAIYLFFGCDDGHSGNFGYVEYPSYYKFWKIDNAESLSDEQLETMIDFSSIQSIIERLEQAEMSDANIILDKQEVLEEFINTLEHIANTNFSEISSILFANISATSYKDQLIHFWHSPLVKSKQKIFEFENKDEVNNTNLTKLYTSLSSAFLEQPEKYENYAKWVDGKLHARHVELKKHIHNLLSSIQPRTKKAFKY